MDRRGGVIVRLVGVQLRAGALRRLDGLRGCRSGGDGGRRRVVAVVQVAEVSRRRGLLLAGLVRGFRFLRLLESHQTSGFLLAAGSALAAGSTAAGRAVALGADRDGLAEFQLAVVDPLLADADVAGFVLAGRDVFDGVGVHRVAVFVGALHQLIDGVVTGADCLDLVDIVFQLVPLRIVARHGVERGPAVLHGELIDVVGVVLRVGTVDHVVLRAEGQIADLQFHGVAAVVHRFRVAPVLDHDDLDVAHQGIGEVKLVGVRRVRRMSPHHDVLVLPDGDGPAAPRREIGGEGGGDGVFPVVLVAPGQRGLDHAVLIEIAVVVIIGDFREIGFDLHGLGAEVADGDRGGGDQVRRSVRVEDGVAVPVDLLRQSRHGDPVPIRVFSLQFKDSLGVAALAGRRHPLRVHGVDAFCRQLVVDRLPVQKVLLRLVEAGVKLFVGVAAGGVTDQDALLAVVDIGAALVVIFVQILHRKALAVLFAGDEDRLHLGGAGDVRGAAGIDVTPDHDLRRVRVRVRRHRLAFRVRARVPPFHGAGEIHLAGQEEGQGAALIDLVGVGGVDALVGGQGQIAVARSVVRHQRQRIVCIGVRAQGIDLGRIVFGDVHQAPDLHGPLPAFRLGHLDVRLREGDFSVRLVQKREVFD